MTTQSTGKGLKLIKLLCFIGFGLSMFGTFGEFNFIVLILSIFVGIAAVVGTWWDHG